AAGLDELLELIRLERRRTDELCTGRSIEDPRCAPHVIVMPVRNDDLLHGGRYVELERRHVARGYGRSRCGIDARVHDEPLAEAKVHRDALADSRTEQREVDLAESRGALQPHSGMNR